jgi:hypothetical protein
MKNGVQIKFRHDFADGLLKMIDEYLSILYTEDDDKLVMAGLAEVKHRLYVKMERVQKEFTMTLTPVQALSLRILYTDFINEPSTYMGSKLMLISEEVAKKYAA